MELGNLAQFDEALFNRYLGFYVQRRRHQLGFTVEQVIQDQNVIDEQKYQTIESGLHILNQTEFDYLRSVLDFEKDEVNNICKLTQVDFMMDLYSETNGNYPKP